MKTYLRIGNDNRVIGVSELDTVPNDTSGFRYMEYNGALGVSDLLLGDTVYVVVNNQLIDTGEPRLRPGPGYNWNAFTNSWQDVRTLQEKRDAKWEAIKAERDRVEFGTLTFQGNVYDIDEVSQRRLQGAIQIGSINSAIQLEWTTADNSAVLLDATDLQNLGVALAQHVDAAHTQARQLRGQIEIATNDAELDAITWTAL